NRLVESLAVPGVVRAVPLYAGVALWRNPDTRRRVRIRVIGFNPLDQPMRLPDVDGQRDVVQAYYTPLMDRRSLPEMRPQETGVETEIHNHHVRIGGQFSLGTCFGVDGTLLVSDQNFARILGRTSLDAVQVGLVCLRPGVDPDQAARELRALLPADVRV